MQAERPSDGGRAGAPRASRSVNLPKALPILVLALGCIAAYLWSSRTPPSAVAWRTDHDAALQSAAAEQHGVLIKFTTPGCTYCRQMDREVFARSDAAELVDDLIPVSVDGSRAPRLLQRYGVEAFPTFIVLAPDGTEVDRTVGAMSRDAFAAFVHRARTARPRPNGP